MTISKKLPPQEFHFRTTFSNAAAEYSTALKYRSFMRTGDAKRKTAYETEGVMSYKKEENQAYRRETRDRERGSQRDSIHERMH